jgi:hypothetical protein
VKGKRKNHSDYYDLSQILRRERKSDIYINNFNNLGNICLSLEKEPRQTVYDF